MIDDYKRGSKASRDYPRKKQEVPPGPPKVFRATKKQILIAKQIKNDVTDKIERLFILIGRS